MVLGTELFKDTLPRLLDKPSHGGPIGLKTAMRTGESHISVKATIDSALIHTRPAGDTELGPQAAMEALAVGFRGTALELHNVERGVKHVVVDEMEGKTRGNRERSPRVRPHDDVIYL